MAGASKVVDVVGPIVDLLVDVTIHAQSVQEPTFATLQEGTWGETHIVDYEGEVMLDGRALTLRRPPWNMGRR